MDFLSIKSKNTKLNHINIVTILTLLCLVSCKSSNYNCYLLEGKKIAITDNKVSKTEIENFIQPYKDRINKDLDSIISFSSETLDKSTGNEYESKMGNFISDAALEIISPLFLKKYNLNIDFCFTNNGGIRAIIPKGNITKRTAFEVMPFENTMVVVALQGDKVLELVKFYLKEKKPHPFSGIEILIDENKALKMIYINTNPLDLIKTYYILTNDYVANGGDNMTFFLENGGVFDMEYKFRNVLIDYFLKHKVLNVSNKKRVNTLIEK